MIKLFNSTDNIFSSNGDKIIIPTKAKETPHKKYISHKGIALLGNIKKTIALSVEPPINQLIIPRHKVIPLTIKLGFGLNKLISCPILLKNESNFLIIAKKSPHKNI